MDRPTIGFAGMTHLGLVSATAVASRGFAVVCYDPDAGLIDRLGRGDLSVIEPGLDELIAGNRGRQRFTSDTAGLGAADVVYIAPDVPTDEQGNSDLGVIRSLIERVAGHLGREALLVVLSQVPPGFTRGLAVLPAERIYYQVETLVFGRAVERAVRPERYILGCADPSRPLPGPLRAVLAAFDCPVLPMRYESAELAKLSINCCLVASIGVANTLAELCEQIGADWSEIAPALRLDARIGRHAYLSPGLGIAGGNLERDLATAIRLAEAHHTDSGIVRAWVANSRHRRDWAAHTIEKLLLREQPQAKVAVWGLAYKENTHSTKNSPSLATIRQLPGTLLALHDPVVPARVAEHPRAVAAATPLAALDGAEALMILTPWPVYREIPPVEIAGAMSGNIVLDPYRVLDADAAVAAGLNYCTLGCAPMAAAQAATRC
ncbi:MAG TPA: nucleotide sugar dehydrogenase [Stellaceae bacterium]|nr:nucleotide sugar dehydrogenase [Stellaceae bacterium]